MRLLVVTTRWPTPDRPSAGVFVRQRLAGVRGATVVTYGSYRLPRPLRFAALVWRALSTRGRFDGVEAHFLLPAGPVGLLAARLRGIPLVVYAHGGDVRQLARRTPFHAALARLVARQADAIVTNSRVSAAHVEQLGRSAVVIPPGVDLQRFRPTPRPPQRRILYLGGRQEHKGFAIAAELADTLAGPGLREVDPATIPELIAEHDVVLVPSFEEPFGLVAAEAIASGRWVVARAVGGLREIVVDGVNGTLVEHRDFAHALREVPDYDPFAVAATAERFDARHEREALERLWTDVLTRVATRDRRAGRDRRRAT